ncbi:MAG: fused response regulator/phosphatase [Rhodococcus sp.]|uniref:PP2C family protein-serine/threonine phosphatase n=1 Tax=Rhodococcus sp. TaxID=1831 RepID=UPI0016BA3813|nr:fused response regulator/phosphatase [Rhodococcus sp. (in: high G+C Gram-positive bacteria)]NLV78579.1 fused response regulator/phosphatase [Rhodococcus sp. (in: high G+C Gram-positive bacteria)]
MDAHPTEDAATHPTLLLIEDDAGDALLVEELVADSAPGTTVTRVPTLRAACVALAAEPPDCILLDLHLPDADGLAALARLREHHDDIPIVVLTGIAEERTGLAAVAAGAQDYLVKGRVEPRLFNRAVQYAIQRKQAERAAAALRASRAQARENARLERGLLPSPLLRSNDVEVVTRYRPGSSSTVLGGDFYDVVQTVDGTVHVLIGDVSGHGPDEAALGVGLRIAWRTLVLAGLTGQDRMGMLEQILLAERSGDRIFATVTSVSMHPDRHTVSVVRAGHPGLLVRGHGTLRWVEAPGGPALGLTPGRGLWPVHRFDLPTDGALVLFTDGLFEGHRGPGRERLGESGLFELASRGSALDAHDFTDTLVRDVDALAGTHGGLTDDIALVHVRWAPHTVEPTADATR